ncbi:MAG: hypothetical protein HPY83_03075 [Anaerolineae bacterium]|nr:hypothetical protein [Anaerolineae bacterium]
MQWQSSGVKQRMTPVLDTTARPFARFMAATIAFVLLSLVMPLRPGTALFYLGAALYVVGYGVVVLALANFRRARTDGIATEGLYRCSRNPQWLGLVGVFTGRALATAAVPPLVLVALLVGSYHYQILLEEEVCRLAYGARYEEYLERVPRYLFG